MNLSSACGVFVALAVLATFAISTGAGAALPGRNGPLAAFTERESREGTYGTLDFVGAPRSAGAAECLSSDNSGLDEETPCARNPAFAPGSRRIAYDLEGRLAVGGLKQSQRVTLRQLTNHDSDPAWDAKGERLFFEGRRSRRRAIYSVRSDGTDLRGPLAPGRAPAVSSRGLVAYVAGGFVRVLDPRSGASRKLARGGYPDWSPSGRSIALERRSATYVVSDTRRKPPRLLLRRARRAVYSPDGKRIAFLRVARGDAGGRYPHYSVFAARLNGSNAKILLRGGEVDTGSEFNSYQEIAWGSR
jgi:hypothetical protein